MNQSSALKSPAQAIVSQSIWQPRGFWIAWESQSSVWYQKLLLLSLLQALRKMLKKHSPSIAFTSSARLRTSSLMLRNQDQFESMFLAHPNQWSLSIPAQVQRSEERRVGKECSSG